MSDIAARLRERANGWWAEHTATEAADRIESLEAERDQIKHEHAWLTGVIQESESKLTTANERIAELEGELKRSTPGQT